MKSNKKIVFICITIIVLCFFYLIVSGKINLSGNKKEEVAITPVNTKIIGSVSNAVVNNITSNEATVNWTTNVPATSQVSYGSTSILRSPTKSYELSTPVDQKFTTNHIIILKNLKPRSQIFYQIISVDQKGQKMPLVERSFVTQGSIGSNIPKTTQTTTTVIKKPVVKTTTTVTHTTIPSTTTPSSASLVISSVSAKNITSTGATIEWKTNIVGTSQVLFGTASGIYLSSTVTDNNLTTAHSVSLSGLLANKKIYYQVVSVDEKGNKVISKENSFQVATVSITGTPKVEFNSLNYGVGVTISWNTNVSSSSKIIYGSASSLNGSYDSSTSLDSVLATSHSLKLINLNAGVKYYYRIIATDAEGTKLTSTEYTFTTPISSNITQSVSSNSVTIQWTTATPTNGKVIFGTISGSYPLSSQLVSSLVTYHSITISGLQSNTKYFYEVVSGSSTSEEHSFITP